MDIETFRKKAEVWIPGAFCAFLSGISLYSEILQPQSWWYITFLSFLPLCFFYAGTSMAKMNNQISQLREKIEEMEKNNNQT